MGQSGPVTRDGTAPFADLLLQAVHGMARPLFVFDRDWRFRYINPAGARLLGRSVEQLAGRGGWEECPAAVGGPFQVAYESVAATGEPASFEAWFEPLATWFQVDAFRTDAGLVVTYDDVTGRRRAEQARVEAIAAREEEAERAAQAAHEAELAGRHLMMLGDISQAMTSTLDADRAAQRFADLVVPLLGDWCLVTVVEDGRRRDVGRAHRDPAMVPAMHAYADLRVETNQTAAPVPTALREGRPVVVQQLTDAQLQQMTTPAARVALAPLRVGAVATFPLLARGELFGAFT